MPTNILFDNLRTRRRLKWGVPAMRLGLVYLLIVVASITLINGGRSQALYILFALCLWNALKFLLFAPISLLLMTTARAHEHQTRRNLRRPSSETAEA